MKLRSARRIIRKKKIYLPTEVWVDIFCFPWIIRKKLAQMVDKIGNRWFGEQLQFYLHEWGKHSLGHLRFTKEGLERECGIFQFQPLEYPQTAMPENIKFCESFQIDHFDNRVFNFFRRIQSLLTANTTLDICFEREMGKDVAKQVKNVRTILGHLLPLIDGVHAINTDDRMLPQLKLSLAEKFNNVKVLDVELTRFVQSSVQPIMEWLTTSSCNEPKLLELYCANDEINQQQFMEATEQSTFVVIFSNDHGSLAFHCENAIGEQLDGMRKDAWEFQVFRHQAIAEAGEKLRQWLAGCGYKDGEYNDGKGCISLCKPTIGRGRIFAMPDLDEDETDKKEDEDEKPSTSKKRRICK